jgi:hypothetical protein
MTSPARPSQSPFATRRRVVLLDGESEGGSLSDHLVDVRAQFESRGFEAVVIDLKRNGADAELIAQIQSGRVRFCYGLSGGGRLYLARGARNRTHADGRA